MARSNDSVFTRRRDLLTKKIKQRMETTNKAFGLDAEGEPVQTPYGHVRVGGQQLNQYWQSLAPREKLERWIGMSEADRAEIRKAAGPRE